ncbi:MAG: hypothetical protein ACO3WN_07510 [Burkholderiaceae bacterium]
MTELNIHWVTSMEMSEPRMLLKPDTWVRELKIRTDNTKHPITIIFFCDGSVDQIELKQGEQ